MSTSILFWRDAQKDGHSISAYWFGYARETDTDIVGSISDFREKKIKAEYFKKNKAHRTLIIARIFWENRDRNRHLSHIVCFGRGEKESWIFNRRKSPRTLVVSAYFRDRRRRQRTSNFVPKISKRGAERQTCASPLRILRTENICSMSCILKGPRKKDMWSCLSVLERPERETSHQTSRHLKGEKTVF